MISSKNLSTVNSFFKNEPLTDFSIKNERIALSDAIKKLEATSLGHLVAAPIINGKEVRRGEPVVRENPSKLSQIIGQVYYAGLDEVRETINLFMNEGKKWSTTSYLQRAEVIRNAARIMKRKKHDLSALIIFESGKTWREADGDVAEAIDFCNYYAEQMLRLGGPIPTSDIPGEENYFFYQPRGISVVIAPWNFPLAIPCGMTVAALVTGNRTVLKPAEQTSLIAAEFARILLEAGVPPSAFALLPGKGELIGKELVEHPEVGLIAFTGSRPVGLGIIKSAAEVRPGQHIIKRVIAELGGKNAIIVDDDADFDEAIKGILHSSFGFAGQKCSACSRVIVVGDAYEPFVRRICEAVEDLTIGEAKNSGSYLGPVIDQEAKDRILKTIQLGERQLKVGFKGTPPTDGHFVPLTIFRDVDPDSQLWQEEIFGPVLCVRPAKSFEDAVLDATKSMYALTGAVFSRNPEHLDYAKEHFKVGNLYINRGSTGAIVGRQPFGGFKMSGIGSKAGGPDYLLQFLEPRTITENTVRRGFAPESVE